MPAPTVAPIGSASAEITEARAHFARGNQPAALNLAIAALKKDPRCFEAYILLSELSITKPGGGLVAEKTARQALALKPDNIDALRLLAHALGLQGRLPEAAEMLEKVHRAQPRDLAVSLALAKAREVVKKFPAAEQLLRAAAERHPTVATVAMALGDFLKRRGKVDEALIWHRRAAGSSDGVLPAVSTGRRHALFLVQLDAAWSCLASVYEVFRADPNWQVTVVALPFLHHHYSTDQERMAVFRFLEKEGIPFKRWDEFTLQPGCADVAFFHMPYDATLPAGWHSSDVLRAVPRMVYVPYALVIVGGDENARYQFDLPLQQRAWMVVAHSPRNRAMFTQHCAMGDHHVVTTGHPKMDALRTLDRIHDDELAKLASGRKLICWNPHFDFRPNGTPFGSGLSTFMRWQEFLLDELAKRPDLALVIRPHPLFFGSLEKHKFWSAAEVASFLARVEAMDNVAIDRRSLYLPAFAHSVAMLSDASSLLLEYAATGKPVLYLRNPHGPGLNDHGELVRDHLYTAEDEAGIRAFLDQVSCGEDPRAAGRAQALPDFIYQPAIGAGAEIKRVINERLNAATQPVVELTSA